MKTLTITILTLELFALLSCEQNTEKKSTDEKQRRDSLENITNYKLALQDSIANSKTIENFSETKSIKPHQISDIYSNIPQAHLSKKDEIAYEIDLGLPPINSDKNKRADFFYNTENSNKTIIYDSWLEYEYMNGVTPCTPDCNTKLYAHTANGVLPIQILKLVIDSQKVCDNFKPLIWVVHEKIDPTPLFVSTMSGTKKNTFIDASTLKTEIVPKWINYDSLFIPLGFKNKRVILYAYARKNNTFIAEVHATGRYEREDCDEDRGMKESNWSGLYYIDENQMRIITPVGFRQYYYGDDFKFVGFEDINGDGELDIITGKPVKLILERYKKGFRSWGFAFFPPCGC